MNKKITLQTLSQASEQDVFNQAAIHMMKQQRKSVASYNELVSLYHGANDTRCPAGCFISDDEYDPSFEGHGWLSLTTNNRVPVDHRSLIASLQDIHDDRDPSQWPSELKKLAEVFGLDVPHNVEEAMNKYCSCC